MGPIQWIVLCVAALMLAYVIVYLFVLRRPPREQTAPGKPPTEFPPSRLDRTLTTEPVRHHVQEQNGIALAFAQDIGARSAQQDSLSCELNQTKAVAIVCDGMGGMADGDQASRQATATVFRQLWEMGPGENPEEVMHDAALLADSEVYAIGEAAGNPTGVGTTLVAAYVANARASWVSVGDSRIYLLRSEQLQRLTRDHIYLMELLEMAEDGTISMEEALSDPTQEALTSFIGAGHPELIDTGSFELRPGDLILLCSDGLYKSVPDEDIRSILLRTMHDLSDSAWMLVGEALRRGGNVQDNTTVVLLHYTG